MGIAFLLTVLAGLSTGIGSLIALFMDKENTKALSFSMGFAGGVMIYVSFVEIFPEAMESLEAMYGGNNHESHMGLFIGLLAFFGGMFLVALIDKLIPSADNPHEFYNTEKEHDKNTKNPKKLMRVGLLTAFALGLHNFPEGAATFVAALNDPVLGVTIAIAIALHNIPEGIAVAMPIYHATGNKKLAFGYSFLSGIVEPIGALVCYGVMVSLGINLGADSAFMSCLLAGVAGIMIFISLDQLLPAAEEYGEHHISIYGVVSGMIIMAISLLLLH